MVTGAAPFEESYNLYAQPSIKDRAIYVWQTIGMEWIKMRERSVFDTLTAKSRLSGNSSREKTTLGRGPIYR